MVATRIEVLTETDSTQDDARERFTGEPSLVIAHRQLRGRGRRGHAWDTAPRAVAASLAFDPGWPTSDLPLLGLVAGLAATDFLEARLKWPNDLMVEEGKIGGILAEALDGGGVVVGMGVNLHWPDAPAGYAAVHATDPGPDEVVAVGTRWAERLLARSATGPSGWDREAYVRRCRTIGRDLTWEPDGSGTAVDVSADGGLVVATATGTEVLHAGAVNDVRAST